MTAREGVHGLDLLAYRSKEDVPALIKAVCAAVSKPVYVAGSIDTAERIAILKEAGAAGFTIGTAALDGKYPAEDKDVSGQLAAIIRDVAALNQHLSPFHKKNLDELVRAVHRHLVAEDRRSDQQYADQARQVRGRVRLALPQAARTNSSLCTRAAC